MKTEPTEEPSPPIAGASDGPTLLHDSPADSSPTAVGDLKSKNSPNEQPSIEPEPTTDSGPVRNSPSDHPTTKDLAPKTSGMKLTKHFQKSIRVLWIPT